MPMRSTPEEQGLVAPETPERLAVPPPPEPELAWPRWALALMVVALLAAMIALRLAAPSDLYDHGQPAPAAHILDAAVNHQWLVQRQPSGALPTKPPMYPWLGALAVQLTGSSDEWVFKLPVLAALAGSTALVWDLARRVVGARAASVAAAAWVANYAVFKLGYSARTDMLVTAWVLLAVWCVQRQREAWSAPWAPAPPEGPPATADQPAPQSAAPPLRWIMLFWLAFAAAVLTDALPALLAPLWLIVALAWDRPGPLRSGRAAQFAGLALAVVVGLAWLGPALWEHPQWLGGARVEIAHRITGLGSGAHGTTPMLAMPGYFVGRFAPWSLLFLMGCAALLIACQEFTADEPLGREHTLWQTLREHPATWTILWVALVLVFLMIPRGRSADYLLPAYSGAAVLVAWLVRQAQQTSGVHRLVTHLTLGGTAIACIVLGVASWWVPRPEALAFLVLDERIAQAVADWDRRWLATYQALAGVSGAAALGLGAVALGLVQQRRYVLGALACAGGVTALLGFYQLTLAEPARPPLHLTSLMAPRAFERVERPNRHGDLILATAQVVGAARRLWPGEPVAFFQVGHTPIQALLGRHEPMDEPALAALEGGGILVADAGEWRRVASRFEGRASLLSRTPRLAESGVELAVIRIAPPDPADAGESPPSAIQAVHPRPGVVDSLTFNTANGRKR